MWPDIFRVGRHLFSEEPVVASLKLSFSCDSSFVRTDTRYGEAKSRPFVTSDGRRVVKMRIPKWSVPVLIQLLSWAGLGSAAGDQAAPLTLGFTLTNANPTVFPAGTQPHLSDLSLGLDFFVKVADLEFKVPIMPL